MSIISALIPLRQKKLEIAALLETSLQLFPLFIFLICKESLIQGILEVGGGACIHDTHAMDTVYLLLPEVPDNQIYLLLGLC